MRNVTAEQRLVATVARKVVEDLFQAESGLRSIARLTAAAPDAAIKTQLQTTFRRQARSLATVITELRLANDYGTDTALRIAAPAIKYDMLSDEQQKVLKEVQKEQSSSKADSGRRSERSYPYERDRPY